MMKLLWFFNLSGNAVQFIKNDLKFNKVYSCFPYKAILYYELTVKYPAHPSPSSCTPRNDKKKLR